MTVSAVDLYERHGAAWAALRSGALIESAWLDRFCALLPGAASILDIGCGSGLPIAQELVRRGFDLTGVDAAVTMIALFRRNLPDVPAHLCDMRTLALRRRFDGLLAWDSFFHLSPDEQRNMIPRFAAHAAPGAALMFTSGTTQGVAFGELEGEPLYHGSLDTSEYHALLDANGFHVVAHVQNDADCGSHTVWLARRRS